MIYICADDYGMCDAASMRIQQCVDQGVLNKVSVFPNFEQIDLNDIRKNKNIRLSLHLNLVEGKRMADDGEADLITDEKGNLKHTFGGLFKLSMFRGKELENQLYNEIKAQVLFWKKILPEGVPFCIDSHQHTHMIPAVFRALIRVLNDESINPTYMRIPAEPILPYLKTPSLYFTYSPVNLVKQWLLKVLWLRNKKYAKNCLINTTYFFGILFSGKMDEKRVSKVLPEYIKLAEKKQRDIEILFHPGYMEKRENYFDNKNIVFEEFYLSENRKTEFDSAMKISERSVL